MKSLNVSGFKKWAIGGLLSVVLLFITFNSVLVYNEAGYQTHIRTIFGDEKVETDVGYATKWFGRATPWKQAQTVQFTLTQEDNVDDSSSSGVYGFRIVFLGNVDAGVEASTRFRLPQGEQFLQIAREYRTPENFLLTAVVPAIKETLQTTASLMSADDYFSGARSEFGAEFENQLKEGQYIIQRKEITRDAIKQRQVVAANTVKGVGVTEEEGLNTSQFVTVKITDSTGKHVRKEQQYRNFGVEVVEARITNVVPNNLYLDRMKKVQNSLAELAVARQDRLKEEEAKLLVIARGEKEVEEKRQETLKDQIGRTTTADTQKQLTIIEANRDLEKADLERQTMETQLVTARLEAQKIKALADAEAYQKRVVLEADGALQQKLAALVAVNKSWAEAASKAPVSQISMGSEGSSNRQSDISEMMSLLTAKAAKDLTIDLKVK